MKQALSIHLQHTFIAISTFLLFVVTATSFAEPANLSLLKKDVKAYHDSGLYEKELSEAIIQAQNYILEQAKTNERCCKESKKLAIVLDIDETSLSNYNKIAKHDFAAKRTQLLHDVQEANSPVISPMLSLYNNAQSHGVKIFFITGRPFSTLKATETNLIRAGYKNWDGLYLRPDHYNDKSIIPFKSESRRLITEQGYTIIASIGDQYSDIKGDYLQKGFKLPNPFYYLP